MNSTNKAGKDLMKAVELLEEIAEGKRTFAEIFELSVEEMYSVAQVGYDLLEVGNLEEAEIVFEGLVAINPYDPYFRTVLGSIYMKKGNFDQAIAEYSFALETCRDDMETMANRGEAYILAEQFEKALFDLEEVMRKQSLLDDSRKEYLGKLIMIAKEKSRRAGE